MAEEQVELDWREGRGGVDIEFDLTCSYISAIIEIWR
jgi:hypothetical protein